ncbi:MAG: NUDIX hydrolase [Hyphomicrobiales bacterium]
MTHPDYPFGQSLREDITTKLASFERRAIDDGDLRHAAVAVVVVKSLDDDGASVLLTYRPAGMRRHARQYALPGGRMDEGETEVETALRELHEELRLELGRDSVIGILDDYPTRSGFRITPIVAWGGEARALDPDPVEVEKVLRIPLTELDTDAIPLFKETQPGEPPILYSLLPSIGHTMFAPTAAMLYQFREVALRGLDTRVAHYNQPEFAWK